MKLSHSLVLVRRRILAPSLRISFSWLQELFEEQDGAQILRTIKAPAEDIPDVIPGLEIAFGERQALVSLDRLDREISLSSRSRLIRGPETPIVFLPSSGMKKDEIGRLWDSIALTEDEQTVVSALKAISPSIEKLVLVQSPTEQTSRTLMVKVAEFDDPVPFKSLGEGVEHLLNISLALIRARRGVVLIDEVENGIHYSVQSALWNIIFRQASSWGTQIFATTHSWDCVEGFQLAASSSRNASGSLFRLEAAGQRHRAIRSRTKGDRSCSARKH